METIQVWTPALCEHNPSCCFHQAVDRDTHAVRYVTPAEAGMIHETLFLTTPNRAKIEYTDTGERTEMDEPALAAVTRPYRVRVTYKPVLDPKDHPQPPATLCNAHRFLGHTEARYLAVRNEFVREQTARQILINVVGADFKDDDYSFTMLPDTVPGVPGARKVRVDYKGLNPSQRNQIKALADLQFGVGQVEV